MKEAYQLYVSLKSQADLVIVMCLFFGAIARLGRDETIGFWAAAKEFYWSLVVGAVITGFMTWLTGWALLSMWWIALGAPLGCSMVVEIVNQRAKELRDMNLKDTISFIFDEIQKRLTRKSTP